MASNWFKVGDFARNVESGWVGKIVDFEEREGEWLAVMVGVDYLAQIVAGLSLEDALSDGDRRWHSPCDLEMVRAASTPG